MPGICGVATWNDTLDFHHYIASMIQPMMHHSWYVKEVWIDPGNLVGFGRALAHAPSTATQDRQGQAEPVVVIDGEISDAERILQGLPGNQASGTLDAADVLAAGYRAEGAAFLSRIEGSFAACIWDPRRHQLHLATDKFGSRPLYLARTATRVVFGTSIKSLLAGGDVSRKMSKEGLATFLTFGYYLRDFTSLEDVRVVPAGTIVSVDLRTGQQGETRYWAFRGSDPVRGSPSELMERLYSLLQESVRIRTADGGTLGLSLSGGLDGRTILGLMAPERARNLITVCIGVPGSLDHSSAARMAAVVGSKHHAHTLDERFLNRYGEHMRQMVRLTDGQYLSQVIVIPQLALYHELGVSALLRGHGGELMHMRKAYNYSIDEEGMSVGTHEALEAWLRKRLGNYMLRGVDQPIVRGMTLQDLGAAAWEAVRADLGEMDEVEPPLQRLWHLFVQQRLRRETATSMRKFRSVAQVRMPYLDGRLVSLLLAMPPELKLGEEIQSYVLARAQPAFLGIRNANTGVRLEAPHWVRRTAAFRLKVLRRLRVPGYQPYERTGLWLRRRLWPFVAEVLTGDEGLEGGLLEPAAVRNVVAEHRNGTRNHTYLILALMAYELGRRYLDDE